MALLFTGSAGLAQSEKKKKGDQTRTVTGTVTASDESMINGAVVQLKNLKSLQIRSFITQKDGSYHFNELSPDVDYELRATFSGTSSSTKTLSSFDSRKEAVINLKLNPQR
jgi:two-component SAPR family response regulator